MENKCRFLNDYNKCKALNVEKISCAICNFHQTEEEWKYKQEKIRKWYKRRGIDYDTYLINFEEEK